MSASDFASYRAIILGDPTCAGPGTTEIAAPEANAAIWGGAVDGNIVVIGTDPVYHAPGGPGGDLGGGPLTQKGIAFATAVSGKTGLYMTLSCYYHGTATGTAVPALSGIGSFTVTGIFTPAGASDCFNNAHIVATHPALVGLTDADLSDWNCSVHEAFDGWPSSFQVLAIAKDFGTYVASDGTTGTPYILARGEGLVPIGSALTPTTAENEVGTNHTVTMTILKGSPGVGVAGISVGFEIVSGPSIGLVGTDITDADGKATFTWSSAVTGTDVVVASYTDPDTKAIVSARASKTWVETKKPPSTKLTKTASASSVGYGKSVTYTYTEQNDGAVDLTSPSVSDDKCSPVTGVLGADLIHNVGDSNNDGILSIGETWRFTCTTKLYADTTNTAIGHGLLPDGTDVTYCADPKFPPKGVFCDQEEMAQARVDVSAGCTPGYWKQDQHFGSWALPYLPGQLFDLYFENAFPGKTLLTVLSQPASALPGPNALNNLGRHTVAALLNAANPAVSGIGFPWTPAEVIALFDGVFPGTNAQYEALKNLFEAANTKGCVLGRDPG